MVIRKKVLGELDRAYATAIMEVNGELNYLIATEGHGPCLAFNEKNWENSTVWDGPGGTMNIIPVPGRKNEFIATQNFFPTFDSKEAQIVHGKCNKEGKWDITPIMKIPYLHRFDIFLLNNQLYFIGATLCTDKEFKDDWSKPGKVYIGKLSEKISEPFELQPVLESITKNHGFCAGEWKGKRAFFVTGVEGAFVIYVPNTEDGAWETEQLLNHEISDMAICDIDGDGCLEIATIEPFHGNKGMIYKNVEGEWKSIYEYEYEFGHVVWGGKILDKPAFIIGGRKGKQELICFQMEEESKNIKTVLIDNTGGPSNIAVINKEDKDVILAANRQIGEVAIYEITK
jgi:hypothetical protein